MNELLKKLLEIADKVTTVANVVSDDPAIDVASELLEIIEHAADAYREHSGEEIDWSRLRHQRHAELPGEE